MASNRGVGGGGGSGLIEFYYKSALSAVVGLLKLQPCLTVHTSLLDDRVIFSLGNQFHS